MAVQRVGGYVFSCGACGTVYPVRRTRGGALQDEVNHHRPVKDRQCDCQVIHDHQHHRVECVFCLPTPVVADSASDSPAATS